jgi:glycosyltransferase involved in cell wall biosynthesis
VKTVVLMPTFNEAKNTETLISEILSTREAVEVLVVDDDFPDMTVSLVKKSLK